jgi:trimeric autotransporter adhesin
MPTYEAMPFARDTGFVSYLQGSYDLTVTPAGSKTPIIGPVSVTLQDGGVYTAVARDGPGGGAPYGLTELDSFLNP